LYNAFIGATTGVAKHYHPNVPRVRELLTRVVDNCKKLNVDERTYFEVMFRQPSETVATWGEYPPLNWLGTDRALEIFEYRWKELIRRIQGTRMTIAEYLQTISFLNLEQYFSHCFYDGVHIVHEQRVKSLAERQQFGLADVFAVFVAYPDVFTDMFLATHPRLTFYLESGTKPVIVDDLEDDIRKEVKLIVEEPLRRLRNQRWRERVFGVREKCKRDEQKRLETDDIRKSRLVEEDWTWL